VLTFFNGRCQRFLNEKVLPCVGEGNGNFGVGEVWCCYGDGVERVVFDEFPPVDAGVLCAIAGGEAPRSLLIEIADDGELGRWMAAVDLGMNFAKESGSNEGELFLGHIILCH